MWPPWKEGLFRLEVDKINYVWIIYFCFTLALTEVSANLRHLNLSNNAIEHLDSTMFSNMPHLLSLSFAHNRLTVLPDNIFIGIGGLRTLDLSSNPLRVNFKSLCHFVRRLNSLRLAGVELETLPTLQLPQLVLIFIFISHGSPWAHIDINK